MAGIDSVQQHRMPSKAHTQHHLHVLTLLSCLYRLPASVNSAIGSTQNSAAFQQHSAQATEHACPRNWLQATCTGCCAGVWRCVEVMCLMCVAGAVGRRCCMPLRTATSYSMHTIFQVNSAAVSHAACWTYTQQMLQLCRRQRVVWWGLGLAADHPHCNTDP